MYDLYDINFQFNDQFCKIRLRYNNIRSLIIYHGTKSSILDLALKRNTI
jgi:hypothetical protein